MAKTNKKLKFEDAMARLEEIVGKMESGEIGIEESIDQYEEAMRLAGHCREILENAEQRIHTIRVGADGTVEKSPLGNRTQPVADEDEFNADAV